MSTSLKEQKIIIFDCQSTGSSTEKDHLLEIAWAVSSADEIQQKTEPEVHSFFLSLPEDVKIPSRISRMTGITDEMLKNSIPPHEAWQLIRSAFEGGIPIAHFAQFEQRWIDNLYTLYSSDDRVPEIMCTREIARRLYPGYATAGA